ncbi:hypothetical protein V8C35DRAFT_301186 [Trichoderma chlorosporum]
MRSGHFNLRPSIIILVSLCHSLRLARTRLQGHTCRNVGLGLLKRLSIHIAMEAIDKPNRDQHFHSCLKARHAPLCPTCQLCLPHTDSLDLAHKKSRT